MEDIGWVKDETPYIIFACQKCKQYMYAKETQKAKKCLRCGKSHKVSDVLNDSEIVNGMTLAVETVKARQNELAISELGTTPEFRSFDDLRIPTSKRPRKKEVKKFDGENDCRHKFKRMLIEIEEFYTKVPYYTFEIFAQNYSIPESELKLLVQQAQEEGSIIKDGNDYRIKVDQFLL